MAYYSGYEQLTKKPLNLVERYKFFMMALVATLGNIIATIWMFAAILYGSRNRAGKLLVGYDQVANAAFGGSEDETISSRAGRFIKERKWACYLCKFLDLLEEDHCKDAVETFIKDLRQVSPQYVGTVHYSTLADYWWEDYNLDDIVFITGSEDPVIPNGFYVIGVKGYTSVTLVQGIPK